MFHGPLCLMRLPCVLLAAGLLVSGFVRPAWAKGENATFPYQALVEADAAYVRSGPGSRYYPTGKLKRGEAVVVHRHDPGGWYMIAPPRGSFSWIPARYVERSAADRGTVTENNVAVRVGSFESDIRELFQRRLSQGDEVVLLGEKPLPPEAGKGPTEVWYKIAPPRGEWRWVMAQALAPVSESFQHNPSLGDPFVRPEGQVRAEDVQRSTTVSSTGETGFEPPEGNTEKRAYLDDGGRAGPVERPVVRREIRRQSYEAGSTRNDAARLRSLLDELDRLDARFRSILDKDPLDWDFSRLEADYRALRDRAESDNLRQMIDTRLARIASSERTRAAHEEEARLALETLKRDADLAARQRLHEAQAQALARPRYDGAGVIRHAGSRRRGGPRFALMAPGGRLLAWLVPAAGVNLDAWVNHSVGVVGTRVYHPDLKADLITVASVNPVRLAP